MKTQNIFLMIFLTAIRFSIIAIGYLIAPFVFLIRAIYITTFTFSTKILHDVFPPRLGVASVNGDEEPQVMKSKCCNSGIQAKMEFGRIKYFYCSKCESEVNMDELMKEKNDERK